MSQPIPRADALVCPACHQFNRPGVTYIEIAEDQRSAYCRTCSVSRPIAQFIPKEPT